MYYDFFYSELIDIIFLNYSDKLDFYNNSIIIVVEKKMLFLKKIVCEMKSINTMKFISQNNI